MMSLLKIMLKLFLFHVLTIIHRELHLYLSGRAHTQSGLPVNQRSMCGSLGWSDELAVVLEKDMHSSLSGWHALQIYALIWFTNIHLSFFTDVLYLVTFKMWILQSVFLISFFSSLLISSYLKTVSLIFSFETIYRIWPCDVYSGTLFSFRLNKYFTKMTAQWGIGRKSESGTQEQIIESYKSLGGEGPSKVI